MTSLDIPTANVIQRILRIRGDNPGTGFTLEVDNRQYVITAKHLVETLNGVSAIEVWVGSDWKRYRVELVGHVGTADISVITFGEMIGTAALPLPAQEAGLVYGQDVYFLGFPYDFLGTIAMAGDYPLPFVKKATVSLLGKGVFYLDGHNNPGFSGGPVVFHPLSGGPMRVAGVVSNYHAVKEWVYGPSGKSNLYYRDNTGIMTAYSIDPAIKLIKANPIGFELA